MILLIIKLTVFKLKAMLSDKILACLMYINMHKDFGVWAPHRPRWINLKQRFHSETSIKYFPSTLRRSYLKTQRSPTAEGLSLPLRVRVNHVIIVTSSFSPFSNSSCFKSVLQILRFHWTGQLVCWKVVLIVEMKLRFHISPA